MKKIISQGRCLWDFRLSGQVIIFSDDKFPSIDACRGHIIVTHIPSPDIVVYMHDALAVVAETGGALCHVAVLALEMGCPIIVAAEGTISKLKNGDKVVLEAENGRGTVYEEAI